MNKKLFDDWANSYDQSVQKSEDDKTYPFYGYTKIQEIIYTQVSEIGQSRILEMGIGTGMMTKKLYEDGHSITGVDFSIEMLKRAQQIMPLNEYIESDFLAAVSKLKDGNYDVVIFSYSIHHLTPINQKYLLEELSLKLKDNGVVIIGDVMTKSKKDMENLALEYSELWDDEEYYPTYDGYNNKVINKYYDLEFQKITNCSGVMKLCKKS